MIRASIISKAAGTIPAAMMPLTVAAAASMLGKPRSSVSTHGGTGRSRTAIRVAMPIVPSLPTKQPRRSKPGASGSKPPSMATLPSASTTSSARTCAEVTPAARQWGPPALVAMLPPMVHACCDDGSGE